MMSAQSPEIAVAALRHEMELRFDRVDERFEDVDGRFNRVDERFNRVEERLERIEGRFERLEERLDTRFDAIGDRIERWIHWSVGTALVVGGTLLAAVIVRVH